MGSVLISTGPVWRPFSTKSRKKTIKKGMQKLMSKKYRKMVPKVTENDAKIDTKIYQFSNFSENGWNARNYLFYNRKRGSEHIKMQEKSIEKRCKVDARKSDAKSMKNDAKKHPKWEPKSDQKLKMSEKKVSKNWCGKLMPERCWKDRISADFRGFGFDFWGVAGGRGEDF